MGTYQNLFAWQKSMNLVKKVYAVTKSFPADEQHGLIEQIRQCVISIPSNIAEGYGRCSIPDYINYLRDAISSIYKLQTQLEISSHLDYIEKKVCGRLFSQSTEIEQLLVTLIKNFSDQEASI